MSKTNKRLIYSDQFTHDNLTGDNFTKQLISRSDKSPLYKIRKQQGFTLEVLAKAAGISASYLSRIEAKTRRMNEEIINRLCMVLKCSPSQLMSSTEQFADYEYKSSRAECDLPVYQTVTGNVIPGADPDDTYLNINSVQEKVFRPAELTAEKAAFALIIMNDVNAPKFQKNDMIYVHPSLTSSVGHAVIVINHHKRYYIGKLIEKNDTQTIIRYYGSNQNVEFNNTDVKVMYSICMTIESYSR